MSAPHGHGYRLTARLRTGCVPLLTAVLGLCISTAASAFSIGHARIESGPDEQLQFSVLIRDVPAGQREDLQVQVAPVAAWQELGLRPQPEVLEADVQLQPGPSDNTVLVRFHGRQPVAAQVVDALIDVNLAGQQERHQVSMLQQPRPTIELPARQGEEAVPVVPSATQMAASQEITVRTGDTLHGIAQRIGSPHGSEFQVLAALYRLNPEAFSQKNMNLLLAGETLVLPDAEQIQRLSDTQARHKYMDHLQRFNRYKEALARGASEDEASAVFTAETVDAPVADDPVDDTMSAAESGHSQDEQPQAASSEPQPAAQEDRLRLAEAGEESAGTVGADDRRAQEKALAHVEQEVAELESRVDALGALVEQADGESQVSDARTAPSGDAASKQSADSTASASTEATARQSAEPATGQSAGVSTDPSADDPTGQSAAATKPQAAMSTAQSADAGTEHNAGTVTAPSADATADQPAALADAPAQGVVQADAPTPAALAKGQGAAAGGDATAATDESGLAAADGAASAAATVAATTSRPLTTGDLATDSTQLPPQTTTGDQDVSWLQAHFIKLMLALLLFIVIFTIWILRRANKTTVELESPDRVTPEMIQAKLDTINLDLEVPPSDEGAAGPAQPKS